MVAGRAYKEGSILSVPSFTIHRDPDVWGADVEAYRPERWFEGNKEAMDMTFNPFSYGPRACVGKNLATMELKLIIASVFRRFDFVLEHPERPVRSLLLLCYTELTDHTLCCSSRRSKVSCASPSSAASVSRLVTETRYFNYTGSTLS